MSVYGAGMRFAHAVCTRLPVSLWGTQDSAARAVFGPRVASVAAAAATYARKPLLIDIIS